MNTPKHPDVLIVGGGLIGCAAAFRLAQRGARVVVVDRGTPGAEASTAAAGMIAPQGETVRPDAFFELGAQSRDLYTAFIAEVEQASGRQVGYRRDGEMLVAMDDAGVHELETIYKAQTAIGLPVERLQPEEARRRVPGLSEDLRMALFLGGDHWLNNEWLMEALVEACRRLGVTFHTQTRVVRLNSNGNGVASVQVAAENGQSSLSAATYVVAAGSWSGDLGVTLPLRPCRGQMLEFETASDLPFVVRSGHHYLVPRAPHRVVVGTTAEYTGYDKAVTAGGLRSILEGTLPFAPFLKDLRFSRAWCGLRPDTPDHLPILGPGPYPNLIFATGHFRNGILLAPITAAIISALIFEGASPYPIQDYSPARFQAAGAKSQPA